MWRGSDNAPSADGFGFAIGLNQGELAAAAEVSV